MTSPKVWITMLGQFPVPKLDSYPIKVLTFLLFPQEGASMEHYWGAQTPSLGKK